MMFERCYMFIQHMYREIIWGGGGKCDVWINKINIDKKSI